MSRKTYFLFVLFGNISAFAYGLGVGFFDEVLNANQALNIVFLVILIYALVSLLTVWVDVFKRYGLSMITIGVICTSPLGTLVYLWHLYYFEANEQKPQERT